MQSLSKIIRRIFGYSDFRTNNDIEGADVRDEGGRARTSDANDIQSVVEVRKELGLNSIMFAAATEQGTMVLFMGSEPLSYSLGMMVNHNRELCDLVRNMAYWLAKVYPRDRAFLLELASHGDVEPRQEPWGPAFPTENPDKTTPFVAELSYYEVAQMCYHVGIAHEAIIKANLNDEKFDLAHSFWDQLWDRLPDSAKMSVTYDESSLAN